METATNYYDFDPQLRLPISQIPEGKQREGPIGSQVRLQNLSSFYKNADLLFIERAIFSWAPKSNFLY